MKGSTLGLATLALTVGFECTDLSTTRAFVAASRDNRELYATALIMNVVNNAFIGPFVWDRTVARYCTVWGDTHGPNRSISKVAAQAIALVFVHAIGYFLVHRAFHTPLLCRFHRLHHRFRAVVLPMTANCVSIVEYALAYMLPFVVGAWLLAPLELALVVAAGWISVCNLLVHTPTLRAPAAAHLSRWCVGTHDHMDHHLRQTSKFAAPTLNIDRLLAATQPTRSNGGGVPPPSKKPPPLE